MRVQTTLLASALLATAAWAGDPKPAEKPVTEKQLDGLVVFLRALDAKGKKLEYVTTNESFVVALSLAAKNDDSLLKASGLDAKELGPVCAQVLSASSVPLLEKLDKKAL